MQDARWATFRPQESGVMVFAHGDPQSKAHPRRLKVGECGSSYHWNQSASGVGFWRWKRLVSREVRQVPKEIGRILTFSHHFSRRRCGIFSWRGAEMQGAPDSIWAASQVL